MPRRLAQKTREPDPFAAPQMVHEHFRRPVNGLTPMVTEPPLDHGSVRRRHRSELHPAADSSAAGGTRGTVVATESRRGSRGHLPGQSFHDGPGLLHGLPGGRRAVALPAASFRIPPDLELARTRPRPGLEVRSCSAAWFAVCCWASRAALHWRLVGAWRPCTATASAGSGGALRRRAAPVAATDRLRAPAPDPCVRPVADRASPPPGSCPSRD